MKNNYYQFMECNDKISEFKDNYKYASCTKMNEDRNTMDVKGSSGSCWIHTFFILFFYNPPKIILDKVINATRLNTDDKKKFHKVILNIYDSYQNTVRGHDNCINFYSNDNIDLIDKISDGNHDSFVQQLRNKKGGYIENFINFFNFVFGEIFIDISYINFSSLPSQLKPTFIYYTEFNNHLNDKTYENTDLNKIITKTNINIFAISITLTLKNNRNHIIAYVKNNQGSWYERDINKFGFEHIGNSVKNVIEYHNNKNRVNRIIIYFITI